MCQLLTGKHIKHGWHGKLIDWQTLTNWQADGQEWSVCVGLLMQVSQPLETFSCTHKQIHRLRTDGLTWTVMVAVDGYPHLIPHIQISMAVYVYKPITPSIWPKVDLLPIYCTFNMIIVYSINLLMYSFLTFQPHQLLRIYSLFSCFFFRFPGCIVVLAHTYCVVTVTTNWCTVFKLRPCRKCITVCIGGETHRPSKAQAVWPGHLRHHTFQYKGSDLWHRGGRPMLYQLS